MISNGWGASFFPNYRPISGRGCTRPQSSIITSRGTLRSAHFKRVSQLLPGPKCKKCPVYNGFLAGLMQEVPIL